jgi:hypothetical protein
VLESGGNGGVADSPELGDGGCRSGEVMLHAGEGGAETIMF